MQQREMQQHVYDFGIAIITVLDTFQEVSFSAEGLVNVVDKAVMQTVPFRHNNGAVEIEWESIDKDGHTALMKTWVDGLLSAHSFPPDAQKLLRAAATSPKVAMDLCEKNKAMARLRVEVETQAGPKPTA